MCQVCTQVVVVVVVILHIICCKVCTFSFDPPLLFLRDQLTVFVWVYFWGLYSTPWICVSVLLQILNCSNYQLCAGLCTKSLASPCKLWNQFIIYKVSLWDLEQSFNQSIDHVGKNSYYNNLLIISPLIQIIDPFHQSFIVFSIEILQIFCQLYT